MKYVPKSEETEFSLASVEKQFEQLGLKEDDLIEEEFEMITEKELQEAPEWRADF